MPDFTIVTDSCCDLPADLAEKLGLAVLPLSFEMEGASFQNDLAWRNMPPEVFYDKLKSGIMSRTSAASVGQFTDALEEICAAGRDALVLAFSSALSATYNSAKIAAEDIKEKYPDRRVAVVDTLSASLGQGLLVYLACRRKEQGATFEEVLQWVEENKLHLCHWFTVDDLKHLKRGGRISGATALVGTMLGIKPVMHMDNEGRLVKVGVARGRLASLMELADRMEKTAIDPAGQTVFISHGNCLGDAETVGNMVKERMGVREVLYNNVGPVIGSHSGPGTVALFFLGTER
ncbi:MAG TPA: DegV family protein [Oscillospiraceae bacterium]|nr:DegV family protein [Oscillospiraceae bacterium]